MVERIDVLWVCEELTSAEHHVIEPSGRGAVLRGTVVVPIDGGPGHIRYAVWTDPGWRTERVEIELDGARRDHHVIEVDDGRWTLDGRRRDDLAGCVDVDLGWTPATNVLPIRRLAPAVGETVTVDAAWLRFPELDLVANRQSYTRLDTETWRYRSGVHDFALTTAHDGVVTRYGDDLWTATAIETS